MSSTKNEPVNISEPDCGRSPIINLRYDRIWMNMVRSARVEDVPGSTLWIHGRDGRDGRDGQLSCVLS